jgi:DNA-binding response OmpR family regulator
MQERKSKARFSDMWILVVGARERLAAPDGAASTLGQLGCAVRVADFWDALGDERWTAPPPATVLIEGMDELDAARAALQRVRAVEGLATVPALLALTVSAVHRLGPDEPFGDFVLSPYVPVELYARIRRLEWRASEFRGQERLKVGQVVLDLAGHAVTVAGTTVDLTQQEFALLRFLAQHRGRVFERDHLLRRVWGVRHYDGSRTVDIHVRRLRMKLGRQGDIIETVRGVGYKVREVT